MGWAIVFDLVVALGAALVAGLLAERLGLNAIVGYLVAGVAVGPTVLNLVRGTEDVTVLAEIGVALLLFTIGLEFSWRQLRRLGGRLLVAAVLAVVATIIVVAAAVLVAGKSMATAVTLGTVCSLGSTAVVLRVLKDRADFDAVYGKRSTGILLVQDALLVPLVLLVTFLGGSSTGLGLQIGMAFVRTAGLVIALVVFVSVIVPRLLDERVVARNRELPILLAVSTCVGATWGAHELGISPAMGAFIAGTLLADTKFSDLMRADVMPLRTVFTTLFFVSIGMLADLPWIVDHLPMVLLGTLAVIASKTLITHLVLRAFVPGFVDSLAAALAVSQIGEFSFVLLKVGYGSNIVDDQTFQAVIAVSILSLLATPVLVTGAKPLARRLAMRLLPLRNLARQERKAVSPGEFTGHVVVVGYGESGQVAVRALTEEGHTVVVVETNPALHRRAQERGFRAVLGDAASNEILLAARTAEAHAVVVTVPDGQIGSSVVANSKSLAPHVPVVARARYHVHAEPLRIAGADKVADEEEEVGETLAGLVDAVTVREGG